MNQQEITNEHFLLALLDQTDGVTRPLLEKMGVASRNLRGDLRRNWSGGRRSRAALDMRIGNELRSDDRCGREGDGEAEG